MAQAAVRCYAPWRDLRLRGQQVRASAVRGYGFWRAQWAPPTKWGLNYAKILALLAASTVSVTVMVAPAGAITGNFQKDFVHEYVGLVAYYDAKDNFLWRCTVRLINPTTFLRPGIVRT